VRKNQNSQRGDCGSPVKRRGQDQQKTTLGKPKEGAIDSPRIRRGQVYPTSHSTERTELEAIEKGGILPAEKKGTRGKPAWGRQLGKNWDVIRSSKQKRATDYRPLGAGRTKRGGCPWVDCCTLESGREEGDTWTAK